MHKSCALALAMLITNAHSVELLFNDDFSSYAGAGLAPGAPRGTLGTLDSSHWRATGLSAGDSAFEQSYLTDDYARGQTSGPVITGGLYAFDVDNQPDTVDTALGIQPTASDFTPGNLTLQVFNTLQSRFAALELWFEIHVRNNAGRSSKLQLSYGLTPEIAASETVLFETSSGEAADTDQWRHTVVRLQIPDARMEPGAGRYFHWYFDDESGSGARDEFAIDDIAVWGHRAPISVPAPGSGALLLLGLGIAGVFVAKKAPMQSRISSNRTVGGQPKSSQLC